MENDRPISILGQNDVGKTALLKLIAWNIKKIDKSNNKSIYLWEEYKRKNRDGNFISPQITITYTLFLNEKWQKHGLEEVSKLEFQVEIIKDDNIVQFNPNGKDIFCYYKDNENNEDNKDKKLLEYFFTSIKIVTKENDRSKIHNNISSFVQQSKQLKENMNVLLPILNIFGLDDDEYINILKLKKVLCVEGEVDYWTIEIAKCMNEELKNKMNEFCVLPLLGKDNLFIVQFLIDKKIDYLIFLDQKPENKDLSDEVHKEIMNKLFCLDKLPSNDNEQSGNNSKIIEPENMLDEKTLKDYKFITEKGNNHKNAWRKLFCHIRDKKYEWKNREKELLEEYAELINNNL